MTTNVDHVLTFASWYVRVGLALWFVLLLLQIASELLD